MILDTPISYIISYSDHYSDHGDDSCNKYTKRIESSSKTGHYIYFYQLYRNKSYRYGRARNG